MATGAAGAGKEWPNLEINAFPIDDGTWRVDWFGGVEFVNRTARWSQPSVQVFLSRLDEETLEAKVPSHKNSGSGFTFLDHRTAETIQQISCWVSVGTLVILQVGDLWRNRRLVGHKDAAVESFNRVCIDKATTNFVKAGFSGDGGFVLPLSEHPWHRNSTNSWCVHITLADDRSLVVPCLELIRFYFGSSSSLMSQLFRLDLERGHLYDVNKTNVWPTRKLSWLELAPDMPLRSAVDIARIAGDGLAWKAAVMIGRSCATGEVHQRFPKMGFPFEGVTDLAAEGKWLPYGGKPKQIFIVQQLISCSYPFPFSKLHYKQHVQTPSSGSRESKGHTFNAGVVGLEGSQGAVQSETTSLVEHDAGHFGTRSISVWNKKQQRFTDLVNKSVSRQKNVESFSGSLTLSASEAINDGAVGIPGSTQRIRPVELLAWSDNRDQAPKCLFPLIKALDEAQASFQVIIDFEDYFWRRYAWDRLRNTDSFDTMFMPISDGQMGPPRFRHLGLLVAEKDNCYALWVAIEDVCYVVRYYSLVGNQTNQAFSREIFQNLVFQALSELLPSQRQVRVGQNSIECVGDQVQRWLMERP